MEIKKKKTTYILFFTEEDQKKIPNQIMSLSGMSNALAQIKGCKVVSVTFSFLSSTTNFEIEIEGEKEKEKLDQIKLIVKNADFV